MRIQHNIMAMNAYRNLGVNNNALSKNLEKLSSGYKINRAGDDAAGLAISEKMRAQVAALDKGIDNANDGISLVQTAEGALTEVHDMLNRMYTLANQSANGTYDDSVDRAALNSECSQLIAEIDRISGSSNFNGINLLDGTGGTNGQFTFRVGDGSGDKISVTIAKADSTTLAVNDASVASATDAETAMGKIKAAINTVSTNRATLGATQNRLEHTVNNLGVMQENVQNAESQIRDTDVAEEMMAYTKNNILIQSAQAMLAQANQIPQGVLQLMQ